MIKRKLQAARNKAAYLAIATTAAAVFQEFGAVRVVKGWSDDVLEVKVTDYMPVDCSGRSGTCFEDDRRTAIAPRLGARVDR